MEFATSYKASNKPSKQRLYVYNAPLHIKSKMLAAHLSKELRQKLGKRSIRVRVGDKVVVMTGQYKKKSGKVESVDVKGQRIYIGGIDRQRKDGSKAAYPFHPSNLVVLELVADKRRNKEHKQAVPAKQKAPAKNAAPTAQPKTEVKSQ